MLEDTASGRKKINLSCGHLFGSLLVFLGCFLYPEAWKKLVSSEAFFILLWLSGLSIFLLFKGYKEDREEAKKSEKERIVSASQVTNSENANDLELWHHVSSLNEYAKFSNLRDEEQKIIELFFTANSTRLKLRRGNPALESLLDKKILQIAGLIKGGAVVYLRPELFFKFKTDKDTVYEKS